jgi:uncharacterized protein with HEPN domain
MQDEDSIRIRHMIDAAESVRQFAEGRKRVDLDTDQMLLFAIVRAIEVIGKAAIKVTVTEEIPTLHLSLKALLDNR